MIFFYISCRQSQKMYVIANQKRDDTSAILSALLLQLNFHYYFYILNFFRRYLSRYLSETRELLRLIYV